MDTDGEGEREWENRLWSRLGLPAKKLGTAPNDARHESAPSAT